MTKPSTVDVAREKLLAERVRRDEWTLARDSARTDLESLQATAGDELLDDPDAAQSVPRRMQELRDRIDTAETAIAAAEIRVDATQAHYLTAEADALEHGVAVAEQHLAQHENRTAELLAALEAHEGRFVPAEPDMDGLPRTPEALPAPRSQVLRGEVEARRRPVLLLREMAAGRDPQHLVAQWHMPVERAYPACVWGPDAVVPAPAYLARLDSTRARRDQLAAATLPEQRAALQRAELALAETTDPVQRRPSNGKGNPTLADRVDGARHHLEQTERVLQEAEGELTQLTVTTGSEYLAEPASS